MIPTLRSTARAVGVLTIACGLAAVSLTGAPLAVAADAAPAYPDVAGAITQVEIPTGNSKPEEIVPGADGAMWFGEPGAYQLGRVTTAGAVSEIPLTRNEDTIQIPGDGPAEIAASGNTLWFTTLYGRELWKLSPGAAPDDLRRRHGR